MFLDERKVWVVGNYSRREGSELDALFAQITDLLHDLLTVPCRLYSTGLICTAAAFSMVLICYRLLMPSPQSNDACGNSV
jgi:hypothetical protein